MNIYNFNDETFKKSKLYQDYVRDNPGLGFLKIRAYAASQAIPIVDLKVVVSKMVDGNKIIFFEGKTNESGVIEKINLPAPKLDNSNLNAPNGTTYEIMATHSDNTNSTYTVNIYENIYVIQTINIVPVLNVMAGDGSGS